MPVVTWKSQRIALPIKNLTRPPWQRIMNACWGNHAQPSHMPMHWATNVISEFVEICYTRKELFSWCFRSIWLFSLQNFVRSCYLMTFITALQGLTYHLPVQSWYTSVFKQRQACSEILFSRRNLQLSYFMSSKIRRSDSMRSFHWLSVNCINFICAAFTLNFQSTFDCWLFLRGESTFTCPYWPESYVALSGVIAGISLKQADVAKRGLMALFNFLWADSTVSTYPPINLKETFQMLDNDLEKQ